MRYDTATSTFFFFNDTATTEIYTLSLHDALPILGRPGHATGPGRERPGRRARRDGSLACRLLPRSHHAQRGRLDRKSTRLNSSHLVISYAVFCLKKKTNYHPTTYTVILL